MIDLLLVDLCNLPRFFFHVRDERERFDCEGVSLRHAGAALHWAMLRARGLAADKLRQGRTVLDHCVEVVDEQGVPIARVRLADAVRFG